MQRHEESRKKARKWGWREGIIAQENDANDYNLLTISMIQKSIFRINELTSEQVNKLLLQSLLTRLLVYSSTCSLVNSFLPRWNRAFLKIINVREGKITPGKGLLLPHIKSFLSERKRCLLISKSLSILL